MSQPISFRGKRVNSKDAGPQDPQCGQRPAEVGAGSGVRIRRNEVEKVRHRAYTLEARGWLVHESGGLFSLGIDDPGARFGAPLAPLSCRTAEAFV